jgi:hypothetical protein
MKDFKKRALFLVLFAAGFFVRVNPAFALFENIALTFNTGDYSRGINFPLNDDYRHESYFSFLNVGLEHQQTNLGFSLSPITFFGWSENNTIGNNEASLLNLRVYWNAVNLFLFNDSDGFNVFLGPFAALNYAFLKESFDWNRYVFSAGVHMGLRMGTPRFLYSLVGFELGYRRIDGTGKYHFDGKVDLGVVAIGALVVAFIVSKASDDGEEKKANSW